jgi:hypothetical protein
MRMLLLYHCLDLGSPLVRRTLVAISPYRQWSSGSSAAIQHLMRMLLLCHDPGWGSSVLGQTLAVALFWCCRLVMGSASVRLY